jgi:glycosyltransferase involved in cell wall biosynthesis
MNSSEPAVSIIVLSYDRPDYLREALDSVAAQTNRDFEIVIADDCSPGSAVDDVLREYSERFESFVYERPERNVGVVANLLRAVAKARGRYVTILCDDDALEPEYIARLTELLDSEESAVAAFCNVNIIDGTGNVNLAETAKFRSRWGRNRMTTGPVVPLFDAALATRSLQPAMGAVFRKDAIAWSDFPEEAAGAWDTWLGYLAAREGRGGAFLAEPLFRYRVHSGALTARRDVRWHRGQVDIYTRFLGDERLSTLRAMFRKRLARYHSELGMALLRRGETVEARHVFERGAQFGKPAKTAIGRVLSYFPDAVVTSIFRFYDRKIRSTH